MAPIMLDQAKKLRGRSNILPWLTAITALLTLAGYSHYLNAENYIGNAAPLSANHQAAISTLVLNIGDDSIATHIQHTLAGQPLPTILGYLITNYMPAASDLLHQLVHDLHLAPGESVLELFARGQSLLAQLKQVSDVQNTTPLIHDTAFLSIMLDKLMSNQRFHSAVHLIRTWPITHNSPCPLHDAIALLAAVQNDPGPIGGDDDRPGSSAQHAAKRQRHDDHQAGPSGAGPSGTAGPAYSYAGQGQAPPSSSSTPAPSLDASAIASMFAVLVSTLSPKNNGGRGRGRG